MFVSLNKENGTNEDLTLRLIFVLENTPFVHVHKNEGHLFCLRANNNTLKKLSSSSSCYYYYYYYYYYYCYYCYYHEVN